MIWREVVVPVRALRRSLRDNYVQRRNKMARNWNATQVEDFLAHLVCETTIGKRAENEEARTFEIKIGDLPLVSLERLIAYGAQRFVNDKLGGSDKDLKT